jgi:hypothetical protein
MVSQNKVLKRIFGSKGTEKAVKSWALTSIWSDCITKVQMGKKLSTVNNTVCLHKRPSWKQDAVPVPYLQSLSWTCHEPHTSGRNKIPRSHFRCEISDFCRGVVGILAILWSCSTWFGLLPTYRDRASVPSCKDPEVQDGAHTLSRNVDKQPNYATQQPRTRISTCWFTLRKAALMVR